MKRTEKKIAITLRLPEDLVRRLRAFAGIRGVMARIAERGIENELSFLEAIESLDIKASRDCLR